MEMFRGEQLGQGTSPREELHYDARIYSNIRSYLGAFVIAVPFYFPFLPIPTTVIYSFHYFFADEQWSNGGLF